MAIGTDRVQVAKYESTSGGGQEGDAGVYGNSTPINTSEDAIESAGGYVHDGVDQDQAVAWWRDSGELFFKDTENPGGKSLTDLSASGSGITEASHKVLRQLIHFIEDGPAEGFTSGVYREITGTLFPTAIVWWESSSKLKKIVERLITWTGVNVTTDKWKVYDTDGTTVLWTVSDAITYSGVFESNRTRTITSGDA